MNKDDKFNDGAFIIKVGYHQWLLEDIGELPKGKLPRKLKKRLKMELDNPNRKIVYKGYFRYVNQSIKK